MVHSLIAAVRYFRMSVAIRHFSPKARAPIWPARPCRYTAAATASSGWRGNCASKPAIMPVSTSPVPPAPIGESNHRALTFQYQRQAALRGELAGGTHPIFLNLGDAPAADARHFA